MDGPYLKISRSAALGYLKERIGWRQDEESCVYQDFEPIVTVEITETYYTTACAIDRHNRACKSEFDIETTFLDLECSFRVNSALLYICVVD